MNYPIQNYEINDIIAIRLKEKKSLGKEFKTLDLALEIVNEFKGKDLLDFAMIGYINKILIDLTQGTEQKIFAIPNNSLEQIYSIVYNNLSKEEQNNYSYQKFLEEFECSRW